MATVWRISCNPGTGNVDIDFDAEEAAQLRLRTNCAMDVQRYKNGLSRIYSGPVSWRSGSLKFRQTGGTLAKVRIIAGLTSVARIYYRYHLDTSLFIYAWIVPEKVEKYFAGFLLGEDVELQFVETETPGVGEVSPGLLYFPNGGFIYGSVG
jgi:hypothetical protein